MSRGRRLRAIGAAVASVLLVGGCAAGTHPGAAAVVGTTEITVGDVDTTSRAVSAALGQEFNSTVALGELVNNALVAEVSKQRSVTVSDAETAEAAKLVVNDPTAFAKFEADPVARDFLRQVAAAAVATIKLGGGTGVKDPKVQVAQQAGVQAVKEASKDVKVEISPRFGQWSDGRIDSKISGSLSEESAQAKAKREAAEQAAQQQQPQG
ncbi:SurA N-terminal domain-containing protein [Kribbella turkmenica]|uniref:SurA N-terminal domain-containing protein n=1 Tax=Kribbella turkmenica TaxID=2530375 RepID=UPI001F1BFDA4|nr:SurA N-terminal domain-containing protein [Kribbella turkmenica]